MTTPDLVRRPDAATSGRGLRPVGAFVVLTLGLSWLLALPLWFGDGLASPWFYPVTLAVMATPAIAALVVVSLVERPSHRARALGLWPLTPVRRLLGYSALGIVGSIALVLVALPIGALLGVYPADVVHFSAYQEVLDEQLRSAGVGLPMSTGTLVALQLALLPLAAVINLVPALGEELGWRGWLLPRLMPLGPVPALLVSGVVWGVWHAPLVLLGYNYPNAPGWLGVLAMVGMCTLVGALLGWLRLRSGSVWPAALAHAALNGAGGTYLLFARAGEPIDTTQATILGWSGWIVPLAIVTLLVATGQFRPAEQSPESGARRREGAA